MPIYTIDMTADVAMTIGNTAKSLMALVNEMDDLLPEEDLIEVLIDSFHRWATIEVKILFPALEQYIDEVDDLMAAAEKRLSVLGALEDTIHLGEGADAPYNDTALKYIAAVKYHLIVDVEDIMPLTLLLPVKVNETLVTKMRELNDELGG